MKPQLTAKTLILLIIVIGFALPQPMDTPIAQAQEIPVRTADLTTPTIVGGEDATPGEFPWQAMLIDKNDRFACGGTLIQPTWVLTAAHCLQHGTITAVVLGAYDRTIPDEPSRQTIAVAKLISHSAYDPQTLENDIGLIQLATPITETANVRPVAILTAAEEAMMRTGSAAKVTGWGTIAEHSILASVLQKVTVPIVDRDTCRVAYGDELTDSMFCAGLVNGGKDSCQGDSGGPLIVQRASVQRGIEQSGWALVGIVSWGNGCARAGYYGVYTNVLRYHPWLVRQIGNTLLDYPLLEEQPILQPTATPVANENSPQVDEILVPENNGEEAVEEEESSDDVDGNIANDSDDNAEGDIDGGVGEPQPDLSGEAALRLERFFYLPMIQH